MSIFRKQASEVKVLAGTNDLESGGTYYRVEKLIKHPKYNNDAIINPNDIGLIKIDGKIAFNDNVQPIDLAVQNVPVGTPLLACKF